jgi:hypothetical protein
MSTNIHLEKGFWGGKPPQKGRKNRKEKKGEFG